MLLAVMPGPGLLYIAGRTLAAGQRDGIASSVGTAVGGLFHALAGAVGVSALLMASAEAFLVLKLAGGAYHDKRISHCMGCLQTAKPCGYKDGLCRAVSKTLRPNTGRTRNLASFFTKARLGEWAIGLF